MTIIYSLTKQAREWRGRGTHLTAALEALKGLGGKATGAQIADYVEEKKLLKTEMDTRQAISWILSYAVRLDLLKAKESK